MGGVARSDQQKYEPHRIVPHARTLRKAREQVMWMVKDGLSATRIRNYLHLWTVWWVKTSELWTYKALLEWFIRMCWDVQPAAIAAGLLQRHSTKLLNGFSFVADGMLVA